MNYFVEGLQGSGKSTLCSLLKEKYPQLAFFAEGDYSPVELAWCAYTGKEEYPKILNRYPALKEEIIKNSHAEEDKMVICYTRVKTADQNFYQDLEGYEIYNGRLPLNEFEKIILHRYERWQGNDQLFECSLFQNIVEDLILFHEQTDEEIREFYRKIKKVLQDKEYRILYLHTDDIPANIDVIRKERLDDQGNEAWFQLMCSYFDSSPYAKRHGLKGEDDLLKHFEHRQQLELQICRELFPERSDILRSKQYSQSEF